jgi:hypothetical protein
MYLCIYVCIYIYICQGEGASVKYLFVCYSEMGFTMRSMSKEKQTNIAGREGMSSKRERERNRESERASERASECER